MIRSKSNFLENGLPQKLDEAIYFMHNQNHPLITIFCFTYCGSVKYNIFAIWKDANGPWWQVVVTAVKCHPCR